MLEQIEQVGRPGGRRLPKIALEAEASEHLGPGGRFEAAQHRLRGDGRVAQRLPTIKTTTGPVTFSRPKLRSTTQVFA